MKFHLISLSFPQRLEFLGDSVLDLLITWHYYQTHSDIDPGELTDLRSASVNNENFAQVAVRRNLQQHLQHCSGLLIGQITEYVKYLSESLDAGKSLHGNKGPKVTCHSKFCYVLHLLLYHFCHYYTSSLCGVSFIIKKNYIFFVLFFLYDTVDFLPDVMVLNYCFSALYFLLCPSF